MKTRKHFAKGINFYKLVWIFAIGSLAGYLLEELWHFINPDYIQNSCQLYGPISPLYGIVSILFVCIIYKIKDKNGIIIFLLSAILGTLAEYFCLLIETKWNIAIFQVHVHQISNICSREIIISCLLWGFLGYFFIKHFYPIINLYIDKIPNLAGIILTWIIVVFIIFYIAIAFVSPKKQTTNQNNKIIYSVLNNALSKVHSNWTSETICVFKNITK